MLSDYGVENKCLKFINKDNMCNIETPFIAHIGSDFVIVTNIDNNNVKCLWRGDLLSIKHSNFFDSWTGVVLLAEKNEKSIEPDYKNNRKFEIFTFSHVYALFFVICTLIITMYVKQHFYSNLHVNLILGINLIGGFCGFQLLKKQIFSKSNYIDKICSLFKIGDCNDILESKAAKIWGLVSWSEIGFAYFISNILLILFFPNYNLYLAFINVLTLPYSLWSIWYQKMKAKQWCVMCLIILLILWGIFLINFSFGYISIPIFSFNDVLIMFMMYISPFLLIITLTSKFIESNKTENLIHEINSIKADEDIFQTVLKKQEHFDIDLSVSKIIFGNPNANTLVSILTNPHCEPCGYMHRRVEKLLKNNCNKMCVQYVFSFFDESLSDSNRFLISAYFNSKTEEFAKILSDWFNHGRYRKEDFFKKFNFTFDTRVEEEFLKHNAWIQKSKLVATPTILINGHYLPEKYKIEDLEYLLDDILLDSVGNSKNSFPIV